MAYMNVMTRNKLKIVIAEAYKLKKKEGKVDLTIQNLNSKILRAKTKLEVVSAVEEKARSIVRRAEFKGKVVMEGDRKEPYGGYGGGYGGMLVAVKVATEVNLMVAA
ncbi:hypothetical protein Fmac_032694 [Flemingia macrophylla]|uniref:Uncharacterized protein n=1 Tax=Flemingia macrophylla TaxID=520843 RepID=A0ABD1L622_9FABA